LNVQQIRPLANPLTLQWSKVTEIVTGYGKERRKGEDEGETKVEKEQKPKWKKGFFEALGSTNWLLLFIAKWVFLPTPGCRRLSTYENHDGGARARRACTTRIITMKQIKDACSIDEST